MTTLAPSNRRIVTPEVATSAPCRGPADLRTEEHALVVTLDLPGYKLPDLTWEVTAKALTIRAIDAARHLHLVIAFEKPVRPGRFVVRATRSIFDVRMEREDRPTARVAA